MSLAKLLTVLLLPAVLGGCASKPVEPLKFSVRGFSISLPPKDDWVLIQQTPDRIVLGKPGDFTGETLTVQLQAVKLPGQTEEALVREVRNSERQSLDPKRFRILQQDVKPYVSGSLSCVMSRMEVEDRDASGPTGPVISLVIESMTVTCPDPARPTQGVSVAYIHQSYPEDKGKQFVDKGMPILNSLVLGETQ